MKKIEYKDRSCECCDSDDLQSVWRYQKACKTRSEQYHWDVNNVVCRRCGFAFVSPVPTEQSLSDYYGDSFSIYTEQAVDYSIDNRVNILKQCQQAINATHYLEIGSNNSPQFLSRVSELFSTLQTVELNDSCDSTYKNLSEVPPNSQQVVASYFVLEHIPSPQEFLETCHTILQDNGMLIIEVPNLYLYPKDPAGLMLYEHVNHFSPTTLIQLAKRCALHVKDITLLNCSRSFGFAAVFQKERNHPAGAMTANPVEYQQALAYMREGRELIESFHAQIEAAKKEITQPGNTVVWGANAICTQLMTGIEPSDSTLIVDSDPRKKDYLISLEVNLPADVIEYFSTCDLVIINSRSHAQVIQQWIEKHTTFEPTANNIIVLDYLHPNALR